MNNQTKTGAMVLVPAVATLEMKNAGWREADRQGIDPESIEMQTIWFAMSNAAPTDQPPAVGGELTADIIRDLCESEPNVVYLCMPQVERVLGRHVTPLLAEIQNLLAAGELLDREHAQTVVSLESRIAELEAQPAKAKVVLPEERTRRTSDLRDEAYDNGWNDCLDEFIQLNGGAE